MCSTRLRFYEHVSKRGASASVSGGGLTIEAEESPTTWIVLIFIVATGGALASSSRTRPLLLTCCYETLCADKPSVRPTPSGGIGVVCYRLAFKSMGDKSDLLPGWDLAPRLSRLYRHIAESSQRLSKLGARFLHFQSVISPRTDAAAAQ